MDKQDYSSKKTIDGVIITDLKTHYMDDGYFTEIARVEGEEKLQFNHSVIFPGAIKAWHYHEEPQFDIWYTFKPLLVGLYDTREESPTFGNKMRFVLCNQTVKIPPRIAHGCTNVMKSNVELFYVVNLLFDPKNPNEGRLPWDFLGESFWKMTLG